MSTATQGLEQGSEAPEPTRAVHLLATTPIFASEVLRQITTGKVYSFKTLSNSSAVVTFVHKTAAEALLQSGPLLLVPTDKNVQTITLRRLPNVDIPIVPSEASRVLDVSLERNEADYSNPALEEGNWLQTLDGGLSDHDIIPAFDNMIVRRDGINLNRRQYKLVKIARFIDRLDEEHTFLQLHYLCMEDAIKDLALWPDDGDYSKPCASFAIDPCAGVRGEDDEGNWEVQSEPERIPIPSIED